MRIFKLTPWFIVWFLLTAILNTVGLVPTTVSEWTIPLAKLLIVVALTAVGLSANLRQMARTGWKPLFLGACLWAVVTTTALVGLYLAGHVG